MRRQGAKPCRKILSCLICYSIFLSVEVRLSQKGVLVSRELTKSSISVLSSSS